MELSDSKIKKFLTFSQKKAFLIFLEMEPSTFSAQARKNKKINPDKKFLYFRKWNFPAPKRLNKTFL